MTRVRVGKFDQHPFACSFQDLRHSRNEWNKQTRNPTGLRIQFDIGRCPQLPQPFEDLQNASSAIAWIEPHGLIALKPNTETVGVSAEGLGRRQVFDARFNSNNSSDDCVLVRHEVPPYDLSV